MPRALDLCCGAGGASVGLYRAGFDVVGCDLRYSKNYPFPMIVCDALRVGDVIDLAAFDFIWASPPCQEHSPARSGRPTRKRCIIAPLREMLAASGVPSCIENVPQAPLRADVALDGGMFGLNTYRQRIFEVSGFLCLAPCEPTPKFGPETRPGAVTVAGGGGNQDLWSAAMGIHWMTRRELVEAVPPIYAQYIAAQSISGLVARPNFAPARKSATWDGSLGQAKVRLETNFGPIRPNFAAAG